VTAKVLEKSGAWYSYNGDKIAQGREKAKQYFLDNPKVAAEVEKSVREKLLADPTITDLAAGNKDDSTPLAVGDAENLIQEIEEPK
jgi:recombination protein RecA